MVEEGKEYNCLNAYIRCEYTLEDYACKSFSATFSYGLNRVLPKRMISPTIATKTAHPKISPASHNSL